MCICATYVEHRPTPGSKLGRDFFCCLTNVYFTNKHICILRDNDGLFTAVICDQAYDPTTPNIDASRRAD